MHIGINQYNKDDMFDLIYHVGNIIHRNDKMDPYDEVRLSMKARAERKQSFVKGCGIGAMSYPFLTYVYRIVRRAADALAWGGIPDEKFWVVFAGGLFIPLFFLIRDYAILKRGEEIFWSDILSLKGKEEGEEE